ncbi:MAG TPA: TIGR03067 domain-containing protein [Steroidobacteraceae bacterium]|nr:TIGR03067 domain-containing protein [Steroidobacteraceae bacterium]
MPASPAPAPPGPALEGAWVPIAASVAGSALRVEELRVRYLLLHGGGYRIIDRSNRVVDRGHYRLDDARSPPAMDIMGEAGPYAGRTMLAVYELRGDELTVCYDLERQQRPADLNPRRDQPLLRITYARAGELSA